MKKSCLVLAILVLYSGMISGQKGSDAKQYKWDFILSGGPSVTEYNYSSGLTCFFEFDRVINNHLKIGLCASTDRFQADGFYSAIYDYTAKLNEISPFIIYEFKKLITIEGGPAYYYLNFSSDFNKFGFILKSSLKYPKTSRFFALLDLQYRYSGVIDKIVETYNYKSYSSFNIGTNHFYFGLGLGIRL